MNSPQVIDNLPNRGQREPFQTALREFVSPQRINSGVFSRREILDCLHLREAFSNHPQRAIEWENFYSPAQLEILARRGQSAALNTRIQITPSCPPQEVSHYLFFLQK